MWGMGCRWTRFQVRHLSCQLPLAVAFLVSSTGPGLGPGGNAASGQMVPIRLTSVHPRPSQVLLPPASESSPPARRAIQNGRGHARRSRCRGPVRPILVGARHSCRAPVVEGKLIPISALAQRNVLQIQCRYFALMTTGQPRCLDFLGHALLRGAQDFLSPSPIPYGTAPGMPQCRPAKANVVLELRRMSGRRRVWKRNPSRPSAWMPRRSSPAASSRVLPCS